MMDVAVLDNPAHIFDNLILPTKLLLAVAIIVTLCFGGYYHYEIFTGAFDASAAGVVGSLVWFVVIEVAKVYLGSKLVLLIFSGGAFESWAKFVGTTLIAGIVTYAFWLSIQISTRQIAEVNTTSRTTEMIRQETFSPPPSIAELDRQIAEVESAIVTAKKSTWRGKPTAEGLTIIDKSTALKLQLSAQRQAEMEAARSEHAQLTAALGVQIQLNAAQLKIYGGVAEAATIFLLLLLGLFVRISYEENKKLLQEDTPPARRSYDRVTEAEPQPETENSIWNNRPPIGFKIGVSAPPPPPLKQPETVVTTAFQPVSVPETKVIVSTEIRDDIEREIAEQIRRIQRYFSKWNNRGKGGGKPETIQENIADAFRVIQTLQRQGDISPAMKQKVSEHWGKFVTEIKTA